MFKKASGNITNDMNGIYIGHFDNAIIEDNKTCAFLCFSDEQRHTIVYAFAITSYSSGKLYFNRITDAYWDFSEFQLIGILYSKTRFYENTSETLLSSLMAGIYFLPGSTMSRFTDSPLTNPGRSIFISGHFDGDERPALLIPSNDNHIYFGHRYGGTDKSYKWEMK